MMAAPRRSYTAGFKLNVVAYAKEMGNRAAGNLFCVNEKQIRYWKKQEDLLRLSHKSKRANRGGSARWSLLEDLLEAWVLEQVAAGKTRLCPKVIQQKAKAIAGEKNIQGFIGGPSWCFRFMRRKKLAFVNVKGRNWIVGNIQHPSKIYKKNEENLCLNLMLSGNQMRKSPQTTLGPRELLRPNIEAEAQEQTDFTPDNVENVEEMKEEIQEDQTDCSMTLMVSDNQSSDMTQQETDSVVMDTYQPSSKRLLVVPEHQYSMMSSLSSMWKEQKMCDASIGNGTTIIMVHKVVLMAISPTLLSSSEVRNNCFLRVNFPANISENAMRAFAEYMYNGLLDLDPLTLTQLQQISYQLGIEELRMLCKTHLCSQSQGSSSIDNIICPGTSLTHLATQSDSFSPQLSVQRKQNPVLEINKRNLLTKSWPQCPGGEGFVSHGPVVVKTEPQNSVQLDCSENLTMQTHTVRPMTTGWPVNEISHSQGSSSTSVTKTGQTSKTFQEHHDRTLESQLVSHIKMEPLDHTASEYGQHYPSLNSDASAPNFPLTKTDPFCATGDCSDSTKFTSVASPAMSTISNFQQKYARNRVKDVQNTPLLRSTIRKVVPSSGDESAMLTRTRNNCLNSTARKDSSTSNTPYPVMLFSSEMENLPLNISETKKAEQYVDLTS